MEATTPRHTMSPLWLLPCGSDQVHGFTFDPIKEVFSDALGYCYLRKIH